MKGINPISLRKTKRTLRRQDFAFSLLRKPKKARWSVKRLCYTLKSDYALAVSMKLGTDTKPAKLIAVLFRCSRSTVKIEYVTLPFEGRLSKQVWLILSEDLEEVLTSPESSYRSSSAYINPGSSYRKQSPRNRNSYPQAQSPSPSMQLPPAAVGMSPPTSGMSPPTSNLNYADSNGNTPDSNLDVEYPTAINSNSIEASSLQLFAGGRLLTKTINYSTRAESRSLQGGLRYESQWLSGWGAQLLIRPSSSGKLALFAEYEQYQFSSYRMINNLFTVAGIVETKSLALQSNLQRWSGGLRYAYPIHTGSLVHQGGIQITYHGSLMNIEQNTDFLGLDMHRGEFGIFGEFIVKPKRFYLGLNTGFYPFVYLGNRSQEFGKSAESYGLNSKLNFRYRSDDGLSLNFYFKLDFTFIDPSGEGRDGRFGKSARDQTISLGLDLGYSSQP